MGSEAFAPTYSNSLKEFGFAKILTMPIFVRALQEIDLEAGVFPHAEQ